MPTRADLIIDASTSIGGYTGTLGAVTTNSAVLTNMVGVTSDDEALTEALLLFPSATNATDRQRTIETWNPETATATWEGATTGSLGTAYVVQPRPSYSYAEWQQAIDKALTVTARTYRKVIPVVPNLNVYPLSLLDWLEGAKDVDAAWVSTSPIMIHNEDFSLWWDGSAAAPDGWTLSGADASVSRETGGLRSAYAVTLTSGADEAAVLSQSVPQPLVQWLTRRTSPTFEPIRASAWVAGGTGSVGIYDGATETATSVAATYPTYARVQITPNAQQTAFTLRLSVPAGENSATFHFGGIWQGTTSDNQGIRDQGSQAYDEVLVEPHNIRNIGGVPTVELPWQLAAAPGQLVVYSRRKYGVLSDAGMLEDQYYRAIEAGAIRWLLSNMKPGQDRTRLDVIMKEHGRIWTNLSMNLIDIPVPRPPNRVTVMGA